MTSPPHVSFAEDLPTPLEAVSARAAREPDGIALVAGDDHWTCARLVRESLRLARIFSRLGVEMGDRLLLNMTTRPELVVSYLACWCAGAIAVPVDLHYDVTKLSDQVEQVRPRLYLGESELYEQVGEAGLAGLAADARLVVGLAPRDDSARPWPSTDPTGDAPLQAPTPTRVERGTPAALMATSGTTGASKLAVWTHGVLAAFAATASARGAGPDAVVPFGSPMVHASAARMMATCLLTGAKAVLTSELTGEALVEAMAVHRCTTFLALPATCAEVARAQRDAPRDLSSMRLCMTAGDVCPKAVEDGFAAAVGRPLLSIWGSTEDSGAAIPAAHPGPLTRFLPEAELRLVDGDGDPVGEGEAGELLLRSSTTAPAYWLSPERTEPLPDGWLHTGDLLRRTPDGHLSYVGRRKDMIASDGEDVAPVEVERFLQSQPGVADAVVVGLSDAGAGPRLGAALVLEPGVDPAAAAAIMAAARRALGPLKTPKRVAIVEALPRDPKLDRRAVAELVAERGRTV